MGVLVLTLTSTYSRPNVYGRVVANLENNANNVPTVIDSETMRTVRRYDIF